MEKKLNQKINVGEMGLGVNIYMHIGQFGDIKQFEDG